MDMEKEQVFQKAHRFGHHATTRLPPRLASRRWCGRKGRVVQGIVQVLGRCHFHDKPHDLSNPLKFSWNIDFSEGSTFIYRVDAWIADVGPQ